MTKECPYCRERQRISKDHIFPEFLGGRSKIRICKPCNDKFGHTFEAAVSKNLFPLWTFLRACGLRFPTGTNIWKRAYKDKATFLEFDLDGNLGATLSAPVILRDKTQRIRGAIFPDAKSAGQFSKSLKDKALAKDVQIRKTVHKGLRPQLNSFNIHIDNNLRKLAIKMCMGLAERLNRNGKILDASSREFLLGAHVQEIPVRIAYLPYESLDDKCPPLSHAIYVEGNNQEQRCYGVVRFFGTLQLYCLLSNHYSASNFGALGILDICLKRERFDEIALLELDEAPLKVTAQQQDDGIRKWARELTNQISATLGPNKGSVRMVPTS